MTPDAPDVADHVGEWRNSDGGLGSNMPYVAWAPGDKDAQLDGEFTADELRAIADFMERKGLYARLRRGGDHDAG